MNQEDMEQTFSKRQLKILLMDDIVQSFPMDVFSEMYQAIEVFLQGKYRLAKQQRLSKINDIDRAVDAIIAVIAMDEAPQLIQKTASLIGHSLGYDDPDAARTGAELLAVTQGMVHDIVQGEDGYYVVGHLRLKKSLKKKIEMLQFLPPAMVQPKDWEKNTGGGYYTETHSIILGKNTHHREYQAYDAINKLQSIPWEIDQDVVANHRNTNQIQMTIGRKQFRRVMELYKDKKFYFVHKYDKRGRIYASGYDLNIQGSEYHKAALNFHRKEPVTDINAMKIAIAGHAGQDKLTWAERIDWFNKGYPFKETDVADWDEPILGDKALRAYEQVLLDEPIGYQMALDATSSGIQILAVLSGCKDSASVCNLVHTGKREDVYMLVRDRMNQQLEPSDHVTRKEVKKPLMTSAYNSRAVPRRMFNDAQLKAFYNAISGLMPGVDEAMKVINMCWQHDKDTHRWVMPDDHVVRCPVTEMTDVELNIKELDFKFKYRYAKQQPSSNFRSLVANITHSVDAYVCREMIRRCDFQLATIHDCFLFPPSKWKEVCQTYREILAEIAQIDLLGSILTDITGEVIRIEKNDPDLYKEILNSEYALS